jgi:hypothetical protein
MALAFVNGQAMGPMEDLAYKQVYGGDIPRSVRQVLECTLVLQAENNAHPTAEQLNKRVQKANGVCRPVARNLIKLAVKYGLISEEEDGPKTFYFLTSDQIAKASKLLDRLNAIPSVMLSQVQDSSDYFDITKIEWPE